jgi:hypothetical protein
MEYVYRSFAQELPGSSWYIWLQFGIIDIFGNCQLLRV